MLFTDKAVQDFMRTAFHSDTDLYLIPDTQPSLSDLLSIADTCEGAVLCLTPCPVFCPVTQPGTVLIENPNTDVVADFYIADIKLAFAQGFEELILNKNIKTVFLPFSECALPWEYGFRQSYFYFGEIRASLPFSIHVCAIFSSDIREESYGFFSSILQSSNFAVIGENKLPTPILIKTTHAEKRYEELLYLAEKGCVKSKAIIFATRREAEEFFRFCHNRRIPCLLLHGGLNEKQNRKNAVSFIKGECFLLAATKTALSTLWIAKADCIYYCGVPYSPAHWQRHKSLLKSRDGELVCCYTPDDIMQNISLIKLSDGYFNTVGTEDFLKKRYLNINQILSLIERSKTP